MWFCANTDLFTSLRRDQSQFLKHLRLKNSLTVTLTCRSIWIGTDAKRWEEKTKDWEEITERSGAWLGECWVQSEAELKTKHTQNNTPAVSAVAIWRLTKKRLWIRYSPTSHLSHIWTSPVSLVAMSPVTKKHSIEWPIGTCTLWNDPW